MKVSARELSLAGLLGAAGLALPFLFHLIGLSKVFLPMYLPILLGGFLLPVPLAGLLGFIIPPISSILTGMPPILPTCPIMMIELTVLGASASLFYRVLRLNLWLSLFSAIILQRLTFAFIIFIIAPIFGFKQDPIPYILAAWATGIPGLILQIVVVPLTLKLIEKGRISR